MLHCYIICIRIEYDAHYFWILLMISTRKRRITSSPSSKKNLEASGRYLSRCLSIGSYFLVQSRAWLHISSSFFFNLVSSCQVFFFWKKPQEFMLRAPLYVSKKGYFTLHYIRHPLDVRLVHGILNILRNNHFSK